MPKAKVSKTQPSNQDLLEAILGISKKADNIDQKYTSLDKKYSSLDHKYTSLDKKFDTLDQKYDSLNQKIDQHIQDSNKVHNDILSAINGFATDVQNQFDKVDLRLKNLENDNQEIFERLDHVEIRLDRIDLRLGEMAYGFELKELDCRVTILEQKIK